MSHPTGRQQHIPHTHTCTQTHSWANTHITGTCSVKGVKNLLSCHKCHPAVTSCSRAAARLFADGWCGRVGGSSGWERSARHSESSSSSSSSLPSSPSSWVWRSTGQITPICGWPWWVEHTAQLAALFRWFKMINFTLKGEESRPIFSTKLMILINTKVCLLSSVSSKTKRYNTITA